MKPKYARVFVKLRPMWMMPAHLSWRSSWARMMALSITPAMVDRIGICVTIFCLTVPGGLWAVYPDDAWLLAPAAWAGWKWSRNFGDPPVISNKRAFLKPHTTIKDNYISGQAGYVNHKRFNNSFMMHVRLLPFYPLFASLRCQCQNAWR